MSETPREKLGRRIKEIRVALLFTVRRFAEVLHTSGTTLSLVETGKRDPSFSMLRELRLRYGLSIDDIIDETCNGNGVEK